MNDGAMQPGEHSTILVALGANLTDERGRTPLQTCQWAAARLDGLCGLHLRAVSRWYRTAPVPASGQPDFVNGVVLLSGAVEPRELLHALHGLEAEAGRTRGVVNAARVLDLDLIAVDGMQVSAPDLVLPHPRMAVRAFVLAPVCDVAPGWRHPDSGQTAAEMLAHISMAGVQPLFTMVACVKWRTLQTGLAGFDAWRA